MTTQTTDRRSVHVLLIEDHELLSQSLAIALKAAGAEVTSPTVTSADELLRLAAEERPDVVLLDLDLGLPDVSGVELVEPLAATGTKVIVVSATPDRMRLAECVRRGAQGFVRKGQPLEELLSAVNDVANERALMTQEQRAALMSELCRQRDAERAGRAAFDRLTRREREVLTALIAGRTATGIARDAVVSEATVRTQIRGILTKLEVTSQLAAVAAAIRIGWRDA